MTVIYPNATYLKGVCGDLHYLVLTSRVLAETTGQYDGKDYLDQTTVCIKRGQCPSEILDLSDILEMDFVNLTKEQVDELCFKYTYCDLDQDATESLEKVDLLKAGNCG